MIVKDPLTYIFPCTKILNLSVNLNIENFKLRRIVSNTSKDTSRFCCVAFYNMFEIQVDILQIINISFSQTVGLRALILGSEVPKFAIFGSCKLNKNTTFRK